MGFGIDQNSNSRLPVSGVFSHLVHLRLRLLVLVVGGCDDRVKVDVVDMEGKEFGKAVVDVKQQTLVTGCYHHHWENRLLLVSHCYDTIGFGRAVVITGSKERVTSISNVFALCDILWFGPLSFKLRISKGC